MTLPLIVDSFTGGGGASPPVAAALVAANCSNLAIQREAAE